MAALMIPVPMETAKILQELDVPGVKDTLDPHITLVYFGEGLPVEQIGKILPVIHKVVESTTPFHVSTETVSNFPAGKDGTPIIALIDSPEIHRFRAKVCQALDQNGIQYSKKWPDYRPHMTLAYDPNPNTKVNIKVPRLSWGAHELLLWGADRGTGKLTVTFPFSIKGKVASTKSQDLFRAYVKLARWAGV